MFKKTTLQFTICHLKKCEKLVEIADNCLVFFQLVKTRDAFYFSWCDNMSCVVMYQPYPLSSPYLPPPGPPGPPIAAHLTGFEQRLPAAAAAATATVAGNSGNCSPSVNSPQSPINHQLPSNGMQQHTVVEPKIEKVKNIYIVHVNIYFLNG